MSATQTAASELTIEQLEQIINVSVEIDTLRDNVLHLLHARQSVNQVRVVEDVAARIAALRDRLAEVLPVELPSSAKAGQFDGLEMRYIELGQLAANVDHVIHGRARAVQVYAARRGGEDVVKRIAELATSPAGTPWMPSGVPGQYL